MAFKTLSCCLGCEEEDKKDQSTARKSKLFNLRISKDCQTYFLIRTKLSKPIQRCVPDQHFTIKDTPKWQ